MNEVQRSWLNAQIMGVELRRRLSAEAMDWMSMPIPPINLADILPPASTYEGIDAMKRYAGQVRGLGQRILQKREWGTIGTINWGGDDTQVDQALMALDIHALAAEAHQQLLANGIAGIIAYIHAETNEPRLEVMSGYLEPLPDPNTSEYYGLLQVWDLPGGLGITARLYDYTDGSIYESQMRGFTTITDLIARGQRIENAPMPTFVMAAADRGGLPIGEVTTLIPLLRAELATQVKLKRLEELQAFDILVLAGQWSDVKTVGPATVLQSPEVGSTAMRVGAGDFKPLVDEHNRLLNRIQADASLPVGIISNYISGAAIREANQAFISACYTYAQKLSVLISRGVAQYSALIGRNPVPIDIGINREIFRQERMAELIALRQNNLISPRQAVYEISQYYPAWKPEDLESWADYIEQNLMALSGQKPETIGGSDFSGVPKISETVSSIQFNESAGQGGAK